MNCSNYSSMPGKPYISGVSSVPKTMLEVKKLLLSIDSACSVRYSNESNER